MSDDEWDWQSCGTAEDTHIDPVHVPRRGGERRGQLLQHIDRAVTDLRRIETRIETWHAEESKWRVISVVLLVLQCLQLLPQNLRDLVSGVFSNFTALLSPRGLAVMLLSHLVFVVIRKVRANRAGLKLLPPAAAASAASGAAATPAPAAPAAAASAAPASAPAASSDSTATPAAKPVQSDTLSREVLREGIPNAPLEAVLVTMRQAVTSPQPELGSLPPLSKPQARVLDMLCTCKSWVTKQKSNELQWNQWECDWNGGHAAGRYEAFLKCPMSFYVKSMIEEAPKAQKIYDPLFESYTVIQDGGSENGQVLYLSFKSPVWGVSQRDLCVFAERSLLSDAEVEFYGLDKLMESLRKQYSCQAQWGELPPLPSRIQFDAPLRRPMVLATQSVEHPKCPENPPYTRGHMSLHGYVLLPLDDEHCYLMEFAGLDPRGTLPTWASDTAQKKVYERFGAMKKHLEGEFKKTK